MENKGVKGQQFYALGVVLQSTTVIGDAVGEYIAAGWRL